MTQKKKILFITDPREWGGCEILLLDYLSAIDYSNLEVVLVTTKDFFSQRIAERRLPIKVELFPFALKGNAWQRFTRFHQFLKQFKPVDKIVYFPGAYYIFKWSEYLAGFWVANKEVYSVENLGLFEPPKEDGKKYFGFIPALRLW